MSLATGLANYNQSLMSMAERWDDFMLNAQLDKPAFWHDRIMRDAYPLFKGTSQKTNIYRGGLVHQAGLAPWSEINTSRKPGPGEPGYDNCAIGDVQRYGYAVETYDYVGYKSAWQSDPLCVSDLKYADQAKDQLELIIQSGVDYGFSLQETFNREMYTWQAIKASRGMVMCEGGQGFIDSSTFRFTYYPNSTIADVDGVQQPYLTFSSTLELSALNWNILDFVHNDLSVRVGSKGAIGRDGGMLTFGLMIDYLDFEKFVLSDASRRQDFNYAYPKEVISGYNMGMKVFRGYALINDGAQMRFRFKDITNGLVRCTRVLPQRGGAQVSFGQIPEPNPDFFNAEVGLGVIFINDVIMNRFVPTLDNLGSGTHFGATPGLNGLWTWINNKDNAGNILGESGLFYGRYEIFPKPLPHAKDAVVFIYRRCTQTWREICSYEVARDTTSGISATAVATSATSADFSATNRLVTVRLANAIAVSFGTPVTITMTGGLTLSALVVDTSLAPVYTFAWAADATNAPADETSFTTAATVVKA